MDIELFHNKENFFIDYENNIYKKNQIQNRTLRVCYQSIDNLDFFLTSEEGKIIYEFLKNQQNKVIFYPDDTIELQKQELDIIKKYEDLFNLKNFHFFQSWYVPNKNINDRCVFKQFFGINLHAAASYFRKQVIDLDFQSYEKDIHFLTLNNVHTIEKEEIFLMYDSLSANNKKKFIASFNFKNIFLEKEIFKSSNFSNIESNMLDSENLKDYYKRTLFEIVCESNDNALTEKSAKPILAGTPFIIWHLSPKIYELYKKMNVDIDYFGLVGKSRYDREVFVKMILQMKIDEIKEKYYSSFELAKKNKINLLKYMKEVEDEILK